MSDDLMAFLNARLDDDEAWARATSEAAERMSTAASADADMERLAPVLLRVMSQPGMLSTLGKWTEMKVPAPTGIDRVFREIEVKRAVLALHSLTAIAGAGADPANRYGICKTCGPIWPCETIRALATIYRDHPDYLPD